ncbi:DUF4998 domain-containing protein [Chitinophaga pollutisoli]|uniref:DUF4998 domain-containing protein n=1 Tax=Chitinophaga pollutisoli TaxID=3133966 RepID=A0ABZ2YTM5_9BACT
MQFKPLHTSFAALAGFLLLGGLLACDKQATDYRAFLNDKEKIYPGVMNQLEALPGRDRVRFSWKPSADPSVKSYKITWNRGQSSQEVAAITHDPAQTMTATVNGLTEDSYDFTVYALDGAGNISVPVERSGIRSYGERYESGLRNRGVVSKWFESATLVIQWATADTVHTGSRIVYTDLAGNEQTVTVDPEVTETRLADCREGEPVSVLSGYKPVRLAIDTFYALKPDTLKF